MVLVGSAGKLSIAASVNSFNSDFAISNAIGWVCNYFSSKAFVGRPDISSAIGSFVVGLLGNVYGKISNSSAFVVMVVG
jgi:uncharacterized membrane protein YjjB (DUF3815 family)